MNLKNSVAGFAKEKEALKVAKEALDSAKAESARVISKYLEENPEEALTCGEIGRLFGVSAPEAYRCMCSFGKRVRASTKTIERRFAEIDDLGHIVPNGTIKTVRGTYTIYANVNRREEENDD